LLGFLLLAPPLAAQVTFAGDARFRPRLDIDDRTGDPARRIERTRFYYLYRLRLNMAANIGEGYYVKSRLAHNGVGFYQRGGEGKLPDVFGDDDNRISDEGARRPELDLMYMYLGRETERFGFDLGLIPVPGFSEPLWDLHYYPDLLVDVPYFIFSTDGGFGGRAFAEVGPGRLGGYVLLDRALSDVVRDASGATLTDNSDQYTAVLSYAVPVGSVVVEPMLMKSFDASVEERLDDGTFDRGTFNAPLTVGANVTLPKLGPLTPTATVGYSTSTDAETLDSPVGEYSAWLVRGKLAGRWGPGDVLTWVDYGERMDQGPEGILDVDTSYLYLWLNYRFPLFESDRGGFYIGPEWRINNIFRDGDIIRQRHKIEINFDATFK
jgi:hypothetical protein